jgi:hypothetical protein
MKKIILYSFLFTYIFLNLNIIQCRENPQFKIVNYNINAKYKSEINTISVDAKLLINNGSDDKYYNFLIKYKIKLKIIKAIQNNTEIPLEYLYSDNDTIKIKMSDNFRDYTYSNIEFVYDIPLDSKIDTSMIFFQWYPFITDNISGWKLNFETANEYFVFSPAIYSQDNFLNKQQGFRFADDIFLRNLPLIITKKNLYTVRPLETKGIKFSYYFYSGDTSVQNKIIFEISESFKYFNQSIGKYKYN